VLSCTIPRTRQRHEDFTVELLGSPQRSPPRLPNGAADGNPVTGTIDRTDPVSRTDDKDMAALVCLFDGKICSQLVDACGSVQREQARARTETASGICTVHEREQGGDDAVVHLIVFGRAREHQPVDLIEEDN